MAVPRHQSSLEGLIDFSSQGPLFANAEARPPLPASTTWLTILKLFGNPFVDGELFESLQVAHIILYALTKADDNCLDEGKKAAVAILNMFDLGVAHLIEGININCLYNALTLSPRAHKNFGDYQIFFEPLSDTDAPPSTYRIGTFRPPALARSLPIVRSFYMHPTIDPHPNAFLPSTARLLTFSISLGQAIISKRFLGIWRMVLYGQMGRQSWVVW